MFRKFIFIITILFVLTINAAFAQTRTETKLPDSAAGKRAAAMLKTIAAGDEASIRKFFEENVSEKFRNAFPMEQNVAIFQRMKRQFGETEIAAAETPAPDTVELTVKGANGKLFQLSVQVSTNAPNLIENIGLRPLKDPNSSANSLMKKPDLAAPGVVGAENRTQLIEATLKTFHEMYVFPEVAREMEKAVRARIEKKEYDNITNAEELANKLTNDLQAVSRDKHVRVIFSDKLLSSNAEDFTPAQVEEKRRKDIRTNFGFAAAQILPGNVGYLDLRRLYLPSDAGEKLAAAMNLLSDTDALILDLRKAPGGSSQMVALVVSYFMGPNPVLINTSFYPSEKETVESWTLKDIPGKRYLNKSVYVLTSKFTFSAGEELAYDLQTQKRATLVGETTGGGANHNVPVRLSEHFQLSVPIGRAINPITKTNWEGVGVKPDINVPVELALKTAQILALKQIAEKSSDEDYKTALKKNIETIQTELDEMKKNVAQAK